MLEVEREATQETVSPQPAAQPAQSLGRRLHKRTAIVTRWLHVYLSMVSFAIVLFFAATGLTLNHPDWFSEHEKVTRYEGTMPVELLGKADGTEPDKLRIVERLRTAHGIHGAVKDVQTDDSQVTVSFEGPGYTADGFVDRSSGHYQLVETRSGFIAVMNDLHKGTSTGKVWPRVIDAAAILLILISLSGLVLIWFVYKRRTSGLVLAAIGASVCWMLYRVFVP
jgi:hypothetical protein